MFGEGAEVVHIQLQAKVATFQGTEIFVVPVNVVYS